jgi:stage III sporulation protein SpoIIIAA
VEKIVKDELDALLQVLPPHICQEICHEGRRDELLEVVMDLGRLPEVRYSRGEAILSSREVTEQDIEYVTSRIGVFSRDNRAGIERTLHRISAIRNRDGRIVGLTCRVGRALYGTIGIIQDLVESGKSILLLGRPGVGKTTMLREVARVLADDLKKRVVIVDTSNEIAGDGDIPHSAIGHARRMQVPTPSMQHAVMIEAVENHMPEVIIIDEIGTELEAQASRTIAERGVQLVATAHGNTLENLILNPTISDLIGGIQTVTLGDEEARRRGTRKSILERKGPPTFDVVVEIKDFERIAIHPDVAEAVDSILRGRSPEVETRWLNGRGGVKSEKTTPPTIGIVEAKQVATMEETPIKIHLFGISHSKLEQAASDMGLSVSLVDTMREADILATTRNYYRRKSQKIRDAEAEGVPIYIIKSNAASHLRRFLETVSNSGEARNTLELAVKEAEEAIDEVSRVGDLVELGPQSAYIRRLQHLMAERYHLTSESVGDEPQRRVKIFKE